MLRVCELFLTFDRFFEGSEKARGEEEREEGMKGREGSPP